MNVVKLMSKLESITSKWWFYVLIIALNFIPPYSSVPVSPSEIGYVTGAVLSEGLILSLSFLYPVFKIIPLVLVALLVKYRNRVSRLFSIYVCISYVLFAFLQNVAFTNAYGFGIVIINVIMFLLVALSWFVEALVKKNDFSVKHIPLWKFWALPLVFIAFWYPANPVTYLPDFSLTGFFTNMAGLAFCLMTPLYIFILTLIHPRVNRFTLRVTSFIGIIIAFYNLLVNFVIAFDQLWWNGLLHIPLTVISLYGFVLSFKKG